MLVNKLDSDVTKMLDHYKVMAIIRMGREYNKSNQIEIEKTLYKLKNKK